MGLLAWLKGLFGGNEPQGLPDIDPETFVFLVIRDARGPMERGEAYEDPIDEALMAAELGEVTGAGSQLGDERQYTESNQRLLDRLGASGWEMRLPRTDVHPGFGC